MAAASGEGRVTLALAADLLVRLYPGLALTPLDDGLGTAALADDLARTAKAIHRDIDLRPRRDRVAFRIVVGATAPPGYCRGVFAGSEGWTALLNPGAPVAGADSDNPFGAAAAACLAVAAAFRAIFSDHLPDGRPDVPVELDVLHGVPGRSSAPVRLPVGIDLSGTHLVGLGAIGRATAWTLARAPALRGDLHGVDHQTIELSNLQRYVGSTQGDQAKRRPKTASVARMFEGTSIEFIGHPLTWGRYLAGRGSWDLDRVAVALDTAEDRIAVQASLPRRILNAWTQPGDLGVSRHDFGVGPCLACLYLPDRGVPSLSENVAGAIGLPESEVRSLLHLGSRVDHALLARIATASGVDIEKLRPFQGEPLASFYAKAVCGTHHFGASRGGDRGAAAVPMAFQSALAGVLLAAEIVADAGSIRTGPIAPLTKINLLRPLGRHLNEPAGRHPSNRCLCHDPDFASAHWAKWSRPGARADEEPMFVAG
ncbi:E2 ligase fold family C protein [Lichenibacterium dinghuense]|uniref:E2 ligase fold family C protein n=1 Tax=Lichenibacterium dinghuense TaxID=2895977 RepID=UPI001F1D6283|nr:E2 ligase fold family C protein [Lichenibacterium sp. 6Y81]